MNDFPYLSLCIPTNGMTHWIIPTLESIYDQNCDTSVFEVIITDNGNNSDLEEILSRKNYPNLLYQHTTDIGFLNQISCFKLSNGKFIKMINHRSILIPGTINKWIDLIKKHEKEQPIIYFTDGYLNKTIIECPNFESFIINMSYLSSWSAGISFWNSDKIKLDSIKIDKMFPTTSILFDIRKESKYIIYNEKYQKMQDESGKGGYNIFKTFAVSYLDIINQLRIDNRISLDTFLVIKKDLFKFLTNWYYKLKLTNNKYTFDLTSISLYMSVYYTKFDYYKMIIICYLLYPIRIGNHIIKYLLKHLKG